MTDFASMTAFAFDLHVIVRGLLVLVVEIGCLLLLEEALDNSETVTFGPCLIARTRCRQESLFFASLTSKSAEREIMEASSA